MELSLQLMVLFCLKHLVADFFLQIPFMYLNKGNITHLGGYLHSAYHVLYSWIILRSAGVSLELMTMLLWFEFVAHYVIDFSKVNICKKFNWTATTSEHYWKMMGLDQMLHMMCYVGMIYYTVEEVVK